MITTKGTKDTKVVINGKITMKGMKETELKR